MKILIFGDDKKAVEPLAKKFDLKIVEKNPEFIISYGGDGTLMRSEHQFPGIPKIILRGGTVCKKCPPFSNEEILKRFKDGKYGFEELWKLEAQARNQILEGINDIIIHNKDPRHAIRYQIWINNKPIGGEIIGDGVVIATSFGSTAYYRSITDSFFEVGIGIAFNNSTEQSDHIVVKEESVIKIKILRGPAVVYADNQEKNIDLNEGDEVLVKKSSKTAKILKLD